VRAIHDVEVVVDPVGWRLGATLNVDQITNRFECVVGNSQGKDDIEMLGYRRKKAVIVPSNKFKYLNRKSTNRSIVRATGFKVSIRG
jgi:hypothetical protein